MRSAGTRSTTFAQRGGFEIVGVYKEKASGAKADRIERKKVMALAQAREIDAILVTELPRCGRSTIDLVQTLQGLGCVRPRHLRPVIRPVDAARQDDRLGDGGARRVRARSYPRAHQVRHRRRQGPRQAARPPTRIASIGLQGDKGPQVGRGWSELPVDRPPCRAQQEHGPSNPATCACSKPTKASVTVLKIVTA
jgi:hypothetical protein